MRKRCNVCCAAASLSPLWLLGSLSENWIHFYSGPVEGECNEAQVLHEGYIIIWCRGGICFIATWMFVCKLSTANVDRRQGEPDELLFLSYESNMRGGCA